MSLSDKPIESILVSDLQMLVDNQFAERKIIEYKATLNVRTESERKEFLSDVSSFANASGGQLIFGIKESAGIPVEVSGLQLDNVDRQITRLEEMIRDGIRPRIPSLSTGSVAIDTDRHAIIIRVAKSWALPHQVTFNKHYRFYSRGSNGKYRLDVDELRIAYGLSETTIGRIRDFRAERLSMIVAQEGPATLEPFPKMILHIIPFDSFSSGKRYDVSSLVDSDLSLRPLYPYVNGHSHRYNFDGLLVYSRSFQSTAVESYLQVFRNGIIEAIDASTLEPRNGHLVIPYEVYETALAEAIPKYLKIQKQMGAEPPFFILVSFLGVSGYIISRGSSYSFQGAPIDRDCLLIPEVLIESFEFDVAQTLRPIFDAVWNAAGWPKCMS